ncbi:MAG: glycosyltransferase [Planctomycetota bacterium]
MPSTDSPMPAESRPAPLPRVSLVVVNWNTRELLLALLRRLTPGPAFGHEILVVDNQSADGSVEAVAREFPAVHVLPQPRNGGFAYGVNRGLEAAAGQWILLLNTDAEASWDAIGSLLDAAEQDPTAAVFGPRIVDEHGATQESTWQRHLPRHYLPQALFLGRLVHRPQPNSAADVDVVSGCVFLIRADALPAIGGFDERFFMYFEEADFCERVRRSGRRVRFLAAPDFVHVGGLSAGQAALRTFLAFRESCLLYHVAWYGRAAAEWVRLCLLLGAAVRLGILCALVLVGKGGRARLHWRLVTMLLRPGLVGELARRPRLVPPLPAAAAVS